MLGTVDDLERLGYVERLPDPDDRRAKLVRLTDRGAAAAAEAGRIVAAIEADWASRLGPRRSQALRRALEELHGIVWPPERSSAETHAPARQ